MRFFFLKCEHLPLREGEKSCCDTCHVTYDNFEDWENYRTSLFEVELKTYDSDGPMTISAEFCCMREAPEYYIDYKRGLEKKIKMDTSLVTTK